MAYIRCDFYSEVLDMNTSMVVLIPDEAKTVSKLDVVYLFHGLSDSCTGWSRYTSIERYAREYRVAVVMPEVQRSFYTDMRHGMKYFSFIHDELPDISNKFFGLSKSYSKRYVMGLSMGGYAALKCLLNTPEFYAGGAAFSAVTDMKAWLLRAQNNGRKNEAEAFFGVDFKISDKADLFNLANRVSHKKLPRIYMACGKQDKLFVDSSNMVSLLKEKGVDLVYESWDGIHDWKFWDEALKKSFDYFFR